MRNKKVFVLVFCAICIALNIVLGTLVTYTKIPLLFLDTIGTIFAAVLFGPWEGASVGAITNILTPLMSGDVKDIPFFIVNMVVGIIVGYVAKKYKFNWLTAIITGVVLSIVCPLIGTPITVWLYGGLTGSGTDLFVVFLKNTGYSIFTSTFIPRITGNFIDKIGSCLLVAGAMRFVPAQYKNLHKKNIYS